MAIYDTSRIKAYNRAGGARGSMDDLFSEMYRLAFKEALDTDKGGKEEVLIDRFTTRYHNRLSRIDDWDNNQVDSLKKSLVIDYKRIKANNPKFATTFDEIYDNELTKLDNLSQRNSKYNIFKQETADNHTTVLGILDSSNKLVAMNEKDPGYNDLKSDITAKITELSKDVGSQRGRAREFSGATDWEYGVGFDFANLQSMSKSLMSEANSTTFLNREEIEGLSQVINGDSTYYNKYKERQAMTSQVEAKGVTESIVASTREISAIESAISGFEEGDLVPIGDARKMKSEWNDYISESKKGIVENKKKLMGIGEFQFETEGLFEHDVDNGYGKPDSDPETGVKKTNKELRAGLIQKKKTIHGEKDKFIADQKSYRKLFGFQFGKGKMTSAISFSDSLKEGEKRDQKTYKKKLKKYRKNISDIQNGIFTEEGLDIINESIKKHEEALFDPYTHKESALRFIEYLNGLKESYLTLKGRSVESYDKQDKALREEFSKLSKV